MASPFSFNRLYAVRSERRLFCRDWRNICGHSRCIFTIAIAAGFRLKQFGAHVTGTFAALRCTAMETEYFRRTRGTTFLGGTTNVFFP